MSHERVVVVGAGGIATAWFPALAEEQVEIAAVVDVDEQAARRRMEEYGVAAELSSDLSAMLRRHQPDFVLDITPPQAHAQVTTAALRAGFPVLGEKPMADSMRAARRMVRTAEETGQLYMVSQTRRWDAQHEVLHRMVRQEALGPLTTANCDFYKACHFGGFREEMESPLILDMAIHHFDMARYLTGQDPVAVYAHEFNPTGSWFQGDVAASCIFEMTGGVVFTYRGSWCANGCETSWNGHWRLVGEQGTVLYEEDEIPCAEELAARPVEGEPTPYGPLTVPSPVVEYPAWRGALREMLAYLREGTLPQTECHDNIKSLAMVFAAMESSRRGRRVQVRAL
jgi:predicted dehydrogenase